MQVDDPEVVREVEQAFWRYEQALVTNDVATLGALFRDDPRTIRYGGAEILYGYAEIEAFRAARSPVGLARTLERTVITTFGRDCAVASTLFRRASAAALYPSDDAANLSRSNVFGSRLRFFKWIEKIKLRASAAGRIGRQMQTWVRFPDGWRIVAAHVSMIDEPREAPHG